MKCKILLIFILLVLLNFTYGQNNDQSTIVNNDDSNLQDSDANLDVVNENVDEDVDEDVDEQSLLEATVASTPAQRRQLKRIQRQHNRVVAQHKSNLQQVAANKALGAKQQQALDQHNKDIAAHAAQQKKNSQIIAANKAVAAKNKKELNKHQRNLGKAKQRQQRHKKQIAANQAKLAAHQESITKNKQSLQINADRLKVQALSAKRNSDYLNKNSGSIRVNTVKLEENGAAIESGIKQLEENERSLRGEIVKVNKINSQNALAIKQTNAELVETQGAVENNTQAIGRTKEVTTKLSDTVKKTATNIEANKERLDKFELDFVRIRNETDFDDVAEDLKQLNGENDKTVEVLEKQQARQETNNAQLKYLNGMIRKLKQELDSKLAEKQPKDPLAQYVQSKLDPQHAILDDQSDALSKKIAELKASNVELSDQMEKDGSSVQDTLENLQEAQTHDMANLVDRQNDEVQEKAQENSQNLAGEHLHQQQSEEHQKFKEEITQQHNDILQGRILQKPEDIELLSTETEKLNNIVGKSLN